MSKRECVRCSAQTRKGRRCKKTTCMYSTYCNVHTKQLFQLYLKPSSIPRSGRGLYTSKTIPANTRIAKYTGTIKPQGGTPTGYDVAIPRGRVIDASSTQACIARYANDCRAQNKRDGQCSGNNSKFSVSTRNGVTSVWLVSTKRIAAGSEIMVSYGRSYWRS